MCLYQAMQTSAVFPDRNALKRVSTYFFKNEHYQKVGAAGP